MIEFGIENKKDINKDKLNYYHHCPILTLLGVNHRINLFHMPKRFFYLCNTEGYINKFLIACIVNTTLHVNKAFKK